MGGVVMNILLLLRRRLILSITIQNGSDSDFVDLGHGKILFGNKNLGAESPNDIGLYYSYGSLVGHDASYGFSSQLWSPVGSGDLSDELDAAYQESHGVCRMPSNDDLQWLLDNTTKSFVNVDDGVSYFQFTSTINGKSIIVPAGGYVADGTQRNLGIAIFLLSRTEYGKSAWRLNVAMSKNKIVYNMNGVTKYYGLNIRPVKNK